MARIPVGAYTLECDVCKSREEVESYWFYTKEFDGYRQEISPVNIELCRECQNFVIP